MRIFIHANNVHQGGGRALLLPLLNAVAEKADWFATLDIRLELDETMINQERIYRVANTLLQRLISEWWLSRKIKEGDLLLCFGNLPPLFRSHGKVLVFLQNRYLIEGTKLSDFSLRTRCRILMERLWLSTRARNVDLFIVQTSTMKRLMDSRFSKKLSTAVLPFISHLDSHNCRSSVNDDPIPYQFDFIYVATGEPHKNHRNLIECWCKLADEGQFPSLCLTVDVHSFPDLCHWIEERITLYKLKISNLGTIPRSEVLTLYMKVRALIFPSKFESLGLPLIEAKQLGLPVLAPEVDYVRDIVDPDEVFDANSPVSIARAVKRFLGVTELPLSILDENEFIDAILFTSEKGS